MRGVVAVLCVLMLSAGLLGCGSGGGGGGGNPDLHIATPAVSDGILGAAYTPVQFVAGSAAGTTTWSLDSGSLPTGMGLSPTGVLQGTPNALGEFDFGIAVTDAVKTATRAYSFTVSQLRLTPIAGAIGTEGWNEIPIVLESQGELGPVSFDVITNASGGALTDTNAIAGTARWTPGTTVGVDDVVRVTDDTSGADYRLTITVRASPVPGHVAEFGMSDVWWVNTEIKRGTHAFRSDYLRALSEVGMLPAQAATTGDGIELEDRVAATARRYLLRELNLYYLRNGDGTRGTGLRASFPFFRPNTPPRFTPGPGTSVGPAPHHFSVMELADFASAGSPGVLGRAFLDPGNGTVEHNGGVSGSGNRLGVFVERLTASFKLWQSGRLLTSNRVTVADDAIIDAMLYDQPVVGPRHSAIDELLTYFSRAFAQVTAHEIGHSIGFDHTGDSGTLMSGLGAGFSNSDLGVSNGVPFTAAEISVMENTNLPGPGRTASPRVGTWREARPEEPRPPLIEIELR